MVHPVLADDEAGSPTGYPSIAIRGSRTCRTLQGDHGLAADRKGVG
jgi:hypothetical protein